MINVEIGSLKKELLYRDKNKYVEKLRIQEITLGLGCWLRWLECMLWVQSPEMHGKALREMTLILRPVREYCEVCSIQKNKTKQKYKTY